MTPDDIDWPATKRRLAESLIGASSEQQEQGAALLKRLCYVEHTCKIVERARPEQRAAWASAAQIAVDNVREHLITL